MSIILLKNFMKKIVFLSLLILLFPQLLFAKTSSDPNVVQWSYTDTKVFDAWNYTTGSSNVVVAVIDNGFDSLHPDIANNVWKNSGEVENNGIDDDNNGYIDDVWGWNFVAEDLNGDGTIDSVESKGNNNPRPKTEKLTDLQKTEGVFNHGTVVAGIIGAVGDNGMYGSGLNWNVKLMNVKVIDNTGSGDLVLLGPAIRYAVNNGASIINISMVGNFMQSDVMDALQYAKSKGVAVFAAAGNDARFLDDDPRYPICADSGASEQLLLGVSAVEETHHLARFSNYGSSCVDITAPGVNVLSDLRFDPAVGLTQGYGGPWNGTSFATPFVAGAAALIKAVQPTWQAPQIYDALLSTTFKTPPQDEAVYAHLFGKGLLQVDKAVQYAINGVSKTPPAPVQTEPTPQVALPPPVIPTPTPAPTPISEPLSVLIFNDQNAQGEIYTYGVKNGFGAPIERKEMIFLQGLESVSRFKGDTTQSMYGVLYFRADGNSIVRLYNNKFERLGGFKKKLSFASTLVLADMLGDAEPEIVLAPKVGDTLLFTVYDKNGNELAHVNSKIKHTGVSITKKFNRETNKDEIVVLYKQGTQVFLESYNEKGILVSQHELSAKPDLQGLFFGDVDGDGVQEFVMVVIDGNTVWTRYYDETGKLLKRTPVFQLINKEKKIHVTFDDFDNDKKFEMIINEAYGGKGVYGIFGKGDTVTLLTTLKNTSTNNYFVVPFVQ